MDATLGVDGDREEQEACSHGDGFVLEGREGLGAVEFKAADDRAEDPEDGREDEDRQNDLFTAGHGTELAKLVADPVLAAGNAFHLAGEENVH